MIDHARLSELLGGGPLSWFVQRLAERLVSGTALEGTITLNRPSEAQREAAERLLGRSPGRGTSLTVPLATVERILVNAGVCASLHEAIEELAAEYLTLERARIVLDASWSAALAALNSRCAGNATLRDLLESLRENGLLARLTGRDPGRATLLVAFAHALHDRLPGRGVTLPELAAEVLGNAHALDPATPHGTIAMHLIATLTHSPLPTDSAGRRDAWAAVGVLCDDLSSSVLALNLPAIGESTGARNLRLHRELGEPCRILLRHLIRDPPRFESSGPAVFVCENPALVAVAAQRLGAGCAPLICIEGQPTTAVRLLLDELARSGRRLLYHGDFDWAGIQIGNLIHARHGAIAWRMAADDYAAAAKGVLLDGPMVEACWDRQLSNLMREDGRAVHEEQVLAILLDDLAT